MHFRLKRSIASRLVRLSRVSIQGSGTQFATHLDPIIEEYHSSKMENCTSYSRSMASYANNEANERP